MVGDWQRVIHTLTRGNIVNSLLSLFLPDPETIPQTNTMILYAQGITAKLCEKVQLLQRGGTLETFFAAPSLQAFVDAVVSLPDWVKTIHDGFFSENLHRFLADHPIPKLEKMFPAPFCNQSETLHKYFNLTMRQKMALDGLCNSDWTKFTETLIDEMVPRETLMAILTSSQSDLDQFWTNTECVVNTVMTLNWTQLIDVQEAQFYVISFAERFDRVVELWPRTQGLLMIYLQPYFQGYPAFRDFPRLYSTLTRFVDHLFSWETFESSDGVIQMFLDGAVFAKEFFNFETNGAPQGLIYFKVWAGKCHLYHGCVYNQAKMNCF